MARKSGYVLACAFDILEEIPFLYPSEEKAMDTCKARMGWQKFCPVCRVSKKKKPAKPFRMMVDERRTERRGKQ